jgi:hypothetical protein
VSGVKAQSGSPELTPGHVPCAAARLVPQVAHWRAGRRAGLRHGATLRLSGAAHQQAPRRTDTIGAMRRARAPSLPSANARLWPAGVAPGSGPDHQDGQRGGTT